jgi:hypothetical protein
MRIQLVIATLALLAVAAPDARGAPCATACKDEIRTCVSAQCQGLKPGPRMRCRRKECASPIVKACYSDLTLCGATRARPKPPPVSGPMSPSY